MAETVLALMSGGVDSSVAAAFLLEEGYHVVGITMKVWDEPEAEGSERRCCSAADAEDARRVCALLGIPHYTANVKAAFRKHVVEPFCMEYIAGRTPNPCIACNTDIKFSLMLRRAQALGAEYVATGHYARISSTDLDDSPKAKPGSKKRFLLLKGRDPAKDQSYFLYQLSQKQLAHIKFPVGEYTKTSIRRKAAELGLATAAKPESQEICFVPGGDYRALISEFSPDSLKPGPIVHVDGEVLGTHGGIANYTIGQRRGLRIAFPRPLYVVGFDLAKNAVIVGTSEYVSAKGLEADSVNWISLHKPREEIRVKARIRYKHGESPATVKVLDGKRASVRFDQPQRSITPGQAVVFYDEETVVGGGVISKAVK